MKSFLPDFHQKLTQDETKCWQASEAQAAPPLLHQPEPPAEGDRVRHLRHAPRQSRPGRALHRGQQPPPHVRAEPRRGRGVWQHGVGPDLADGWTGSDSCQGTR